MVNRRELFDECLNLLNAAGKESAEFDTLCIFQDMLGDKNPLFSPMKAVEENDAAKIRDITAKRAKGQPLQYLLGKWEFYGYPFYVGEGVLIPRPETEQLVENVIDICRDNGLTAPVIADLCSGSGCIAITLKNELPSAKVSAYELSDKAFGYLERNKAMNNADISLIKGDVTDESSVGSAGCFDIIVSNPPYLTKDEMDHLQTEVTYEPELALDGGDDGLDLIRSITEIWKKHLNKGGWLCYEFGDAQHEQVGDILAANGFTNITFSRDFSGIVRTVAAQIPEV
ncbi:MAG: peptide chain release factor N(5)-glutamine methyltransferase [Ruminococcus sp.]|nr:peptide chain release factor N(5)-glutamine methyltransferase [Ruminococcus sp.]